MSSSPLDLSQLSVDRSSTVSTADRPGRRHWLTRYVVPAVILLGFTGLMVAAAGGRLWPRRQVTVLPVIVSRAEVQQAGAALFQAAGWVEPRPTAISAAALAPGVVEQLLVVEGQLVQKDEPIARLIAVDAELAARQAQAVVAIREGELGRAQAELRAAKVRVEQPVHLQVVLADANSMLAKARTELSKLPYLIEAAEAALQYAASNLEGKRAAKEGISGRLLQQAESEHAEADAKLRELRSREPYLQQEASALQNKVKSLQTQLTLLVEETRQLQEAEAKVQSAKAVLDEARLQVEQAELMLSRMVVRAPISGRILRLVVAPGTRVMGSEATAGQSSSTVVQMYDPKRLQVRADVRLEDIPQIQPGQPVEITTASSSETIRGRVLQATSSANVQKNTLEVKVELLDPPPTVTPEMLVTATFLTPQSAMPSADQESQSERILVPRQLIQTSDSVSVVWTVDARGQARSRDVVLGKATLGDLAEVISGLDPTDKLIVSGMEGLESGMRVEIIGEDQTMGIGRHEN